MTNPQLQKVFVMGGATLDTIIVYEDMEALTLQRKNFQQSYLLLEEGKKIEVAEQHYFSGGGATNTAVSFKKLGYQVSLLCKLGQDAPGEMVKAELARYGVDLSKILYSHTEGTASSFVVPSLKGDRTVFAYRGANSRLTVDELPLQDLKDYAFLYITSLSKQAAECLPAIVTAAQQHHVPVAINPGISQLKLGSGFLKAALPGVDILILNYDEAKQFMVSLMQVDTHLREVVSLEAPLDMGSQKLLDVTTVFQDVRFSLRQFFSEVLKLGPRIVVVTNGGEGVFVATQDKLYFHPSYATEVVNTLGAGDAFGSCFVGMIYAGVSIQDAMQRAVLNSASVIAHPDAKTGLLSLAELEAGQQQLKGMVVQEMGW